MSTLVEVRESGSAVITVKDAAELLGCDPRTVTAELSIHGGEIPARRIGRRVVIPRVPFLAWLEGAPHATHVEPQAAHVTVGVALLRAKLIEVLASLEGAE